MKEKQKKRFAIPEWLKTAVIALLSLSLVCMFIVYSVFLTGSDSAEYTPEDFLGLFKDSAKVNSLEKFDYSYTIPGFIGFSLPSRDNSFGLLYDNSDISGVYESLIPQFRSVIGPYAESTSLSDADGDAMWKNAKKDNYIFIKYHTDIPRSILYCFISADMSPSELGPEYISEFFILENASGEIYLLARDSDRSYTLYEYPARGIPQTNIFETISYNELRNAVDYSFISELDSDPYLEENNLSEKISDTVPVLDRNMFFIGGLNIDSGFTAMSEDELASARESLQKIFSLNPDKTQFYTEENGDNYIYEDSKTLSIGSDGSCEYKYVGSGGAPLSYMLPYLPENDTPDLFDCVCYTLGVIEEFGKAGGLLSRDDGFGLVLSGIYSEDDTLYITYGYTFSNIAVTTGGAHEAFRFGIKDGLLVYAKAYFAEFSDMDYFITVSDVLWMARLYIASEDTYTDMRPSVEFGKIPGTGTVSWKLWSR